MPSDFEETEKVPTIDDLIDATMLQMTTVGVDPKKAKELVEVLEGLHGIKAKARRAPVSRDTIALIAGNLAGILLIVAYEQKHIVTSKGLGQIIRPR